ncbi:uncharacterized protein DMENIID0001_167910 [Sergentomyia squamirostris]
MPPPAKKPKFSGPRRQSARLQQKNLKIPSLNDDCLLHIFSYLNLRHLAVVEQVCKHFRNLAERTYHVYRVLDFDVEKCSSARVLKKVISKIGDNVQIIRSGRDAELSELIDILGVMLRCRALREIVFQSTFFDLRATLAFTSIFCAKDMVLDLYNYPHLHQSQLKRLTMSDCSLTDSYHTVFYGLSCISSLEYVDISDNEEITGKCLIYFQNLKKILLTDCYNLEADHFVKFCQQNRTLEYLAIEGCRELNQKCIDVIAGDLKHLKRLSLSMDDFPDQVNFLPLANLPELVDLGIYNCSETDLPLLRCLLHNNRLQHLSITISFDEDDATAEKIFQVAVKFSKLKSFHLSKIKLNYQFNDACLKQALMVNVEEVDLNDSTVTDHGVYEFLQKCPSLKSLDITECTNVTDELAVKLMPDWNHKFKQLRINAEGTQISKKNLIIFARK